MAASVAATPAAARNAHPCAGDALLKAERLLRLHFGDPDMPPIDMEREVRTIAPVRAPLGRGSLDVLEVWGHVYRASYRMRFLYAQIPDMCALMGQEILENADPY